MVTTACHSSACSVSNRTRPLWSLHVHMVSTLYHILKSSFGDLRTVSTRQNKECLTERIDNGTPAVLSVRVHLIGYFEDYSL